MKKYTRVHPQKKVTLLKKQLVLCGIILMLGIQGMIAVGSSPVLAAVPSAAMPVTNSVEASQTAVTGDAKAVVEDVRPVTSASEDEIYEVDATYELTDNNGAFTVEVTSQVNAETNAVTVVQKRVRRANEIIQEETDGTLIVLSNNELQTITLAHEKQQVQKCITNAVEPLVAVEKLRATNTERHRYIIQAQKSHTLQYQERLLSTDETEFLVIENNLPTLLTNDDVIKICEADEAYEETLVQYAQSILDAEAAKKIRDLKMDISHQDVSTLSALQTYMNDDNWEPQEGHSSPYQQFVTPDDPAVQALAQQCSTIEDAYEIALQWIWISDNDLFDQQEIWLHPGTFLTETPTYENSPVYGQIASDCSEQANTLVSFFRAMGVPAENVRVALGEVNFNGEAGGHAWVEVLTEDGKWLPLDPTSGPYYDKELVNRQGLDYTYWMYHEYPITERWVYYNDVYYSEATGDILIEEWQQDYEVFTAGDLTKGFAQIETSISLLFYIGLLGIIFIFLIIGLFFFKKIR